MKQISILLLVLFLSSCFESKPTRVVIVDKSFNDGYAYQEPVVYQKEVNTTTKVKKTIVKQKTKAKPKQKNTIKTYKKTTNAQWISPINAKVYKSFSKSNQGITFDSSANQEVVAIASGDVVYSGDSLKSYGFMVIIKHKYGFYSHYMFNQNTAVSVGDKVKQGDKIAITSANKFYLSMKKFTTVVNPSKYINFDE